MGVSGLIDDLGVWFCDLWLVGWLTPMCNLYLLVSLPIWKICIRRNWIEFPQTSVLSIQKKTCLFNHLVLLAAPTKKPWSSETNEGLRTCDSWKKNKSNQKIPSCHPPVCRHCFCRFQAGHILGKTTAVDASEIAVEHKKLDGCEQKTMLKYGDSLSTWISWWEFSYEA